MGVVGSPFTEDPDKQIILATSISSTFVLPKSIGDLSPQERSKPKVVYPTKIINLDQFKEISLFLGREGTICQLQLYLKFHKNVIF